MHQEDEPCRWQVLKGGLPVQLCKTYEEAEEVAIEYDADDVRCIPDEF